MVAKLLQFVAGGVLLCCFFSAQAPAQNSAAPVAVVSVSAMLPLEPDPKIAAAPPLYPGDSGFMPITGSERVSLYFKGFWGSPVTYALAATAASANMIAGEPEGWGSHASGYAKRFGTATALYGVEASVRAAGDAGLGLDPRYYSCRCTNVAARSLHALKMTLLAYDSDGGLHLDGPRLVGDYGGSMLVTTWYPANYSPLKQGIKMGHVQIGLDGGMNLAREFAPELKRIFGIFHPSTSQQ